MTITLSALETRLQNRLGFTSLSTLQQNMLREALNASVGRALTDGAPGLNRTIVSCPLGGYTATDPVSYSLGSDYIVSDNSENFSAAGLRPGDVLELTSGSTTRKLLVHYVDTANTDRIYIGSRLEQAYSAATLIVRRRALALPHGGRVVEIRDSKLRELTYDVQAVNKQPFQTGSPSRWQQSIDIEGSGENFIALVPAPSAVTDYTITQAYDIDRLTGDSDTFELPEGLIDVVLARAVRLYRSWASNDQIELAASENEVREADDQSRDRNAGMGMFIK